MEFNSIISGTTAVEVATVVGVGNQPPAYAIPRVNSFDGIAGYNVKASNTQRLRSSIAKVLTGTSSAEWAFIGDSTTISSVTGAGAAQYNSQWPYYLRTLQTQIPQASASDGWVRCLDAVNVGDPRIVATGTGWTGVFGTCDFSNAVNDNLVYTTLSGTGTLCSVMYYDNADGSAFTISVNGAASGPGFGTVTCSGPVGWKVASPAGGFAAANNVKVNHTVQGTSGIYIAAISLTNPNTLLIHNLAQSTTRAGMTGLLSWTDPTYGAFNPYGCYVQPHKIGLTKTDPDVVFIGLGINDLSNGASQSATITAIQTLAQAYPNSDIVLIAMQAFSNTYFTDAVWTSYVNALYNLADILNVPLLDFRNLSGTYANSAAQGYTTDGAGHFTAWGNALLARGVIKRLF